MLDAWLVYPPPIAPPELVQGVEEYAKKNEYKAFEIKEWFAEKELNGAKRIYAKMLKETEKAVLLKIIMTYAVFDANDKRMNEIDFAKLYERKDGKIVGVILKEKWIPKSVILQDKSLR